MLHLGPYVVSISANSSGDFGAPLGPQSRVFVKELGRLIRLKSGERRSCSLIFVAKSISGHTAGEYSVAVLGTFIGES